MGLTYTEIDKNLNYFMEGLHSFPRIADTLPLIRTLYCWVLSKEVSSNIFKSLVWRDLGLNPGLPDHLRTLYPLGQWASLKTKDYHYYLIETNGWRRNLTATTHECWEQYWTSPGNNTPRDANCTATCLPSRKLYRLDEPDTPDTAGEARTSS